jgi:hypothetical protein
MIRVERDENAAKHDLMNVDSESRPVSDMRNSTGLYFTTKHDYEVCYVVSLRMYD